MRPKRRPGGPEPRGSSDDLRVNERIRIPRVLLIDHLGEQRGIIATEEAMKIAQEAGLDLVEVSPQARPPVCRIMNYGQYKYQLKKKAKGHKAHQAKVKEIRLHPATGEHDIEVRLRQAKGFLDHGDKVLVAVWFKGREVQHRERGEVLCTRFIDQLAPCSKLEKPVSLDGKRMSILLAPLTKDEARAKAKQLEQKAAQPQVAPMPKQNVPVAPLRPAPPPPPRPGHANAAPAPTPPTGTPTGTPQGTGGTK
jgi:translation initiation factor IF-3